MDSRKTASESVLRGDDCYRFRCGPPKAGLDLSFSPTKLRQRPASICSSPKRTRPRPTIQEVQNDCRKYAL